MKTFEEVSKHCPFCFTGTKYETYICSARTAIPNLKYELKECKKENCGLWYFVIFLRD